MQYSYTDFECMGTVFRFSFEQEQLELAENLLPSAMALLEEADSRFSTYKPNSEVSRIRLGELAVNLSSWETQLVASEADGWMEKTAGHFNPIDPSGLWDPSGLVKAWATQGAANLFESQGLTAFTINAGGDVLIGSGVSYTQLGRVGIANGRSIASEELAPLAVVDLQGTEFAAVATSGTAERGDHIWGGSLLQATVVAPDIVTADIWATAIVAGGLEQARLESSIEFLVLRENGETESSSGFDKLALELSAIGGNK